MIVIVPNVVLPAATAGHASSSAWSSAAPEVADVGQGERRSSYCSNTYCVVVSVVEEDVDR